MKVRTAILSVLALSAVLTYTYAQAQDDKVVRGKYLAEEVAKCQECHTPKTENGEFIKSQWMKGASLSFTPAATVPGWRPKSPDISSTSMLWKRWNDDGMVKFFETGRNPRGGKAGPPMPGYAMRHDDAEAIVAFLKSLP
ncbi:MAG TPA: c-type cytochrome [Bryobacteraceae bacterium]|nr:c-type cytochrome [Bryobacteraceae bacterium]